MNGTRDEGARDQMKSARTTGRPLGTALLLVGAAVAGGCSSGLGNNLDLDGEEGLVTETGLGLDLGLDLTDPIGSDMAVAGALIPGSERRISFVAFTTAAADDDADGAGGSLSKDGVPDSNGASDVFVMAIEDDLGGGGQPVAFSRALVNTFRHSRCVQCHAIGSDPEATEPFAFPGNAHPGGPQPVMNDDCLGCHIAANIGVEVEWRAPRANNTPSQNFNMRSDTLAELAARAQVVDFDEHLLNDSRVTWAIESGVVPFEGLAGSSPLWSAPGYEDVDVGPVPITFEAFENQLLDWRAAGFPVTAEASVRDITLVSLATTGVTSANGASSQPSLTFVPDPTFDPANPSAIRVGQLIIAYTSTASDLVAAGTGTADIYTTSLDVFVDRDPVSSTTLAGGLDIVNGGGSTSLVSAANGGGAANGASSSPSIDASGDLVAFSSVATNLIAGFVNGNGAAADVYLRDQGLASTQLVSASTAGSTNGGDGESGEPALSAIGEAIAFSSLATDLTVDPDSNGVRDVFFTQRAAGTFSGLQTASRPAPGAEADAASGSPDIAVTSAGAVGLVFESAATNLAAVEPGTTNVFLNEGGAVTLMSQSRSGGVSTPGNGNSTAPELTPSGGELVFSTEATNLDVLQTTDQNAAEDVLIVDLVGFRGTGEVLGRRVSLNWAGLDAEAASSGAFVGTFRESDGFFGNRTFVTFRSTAEDVGVSRQDVVTKFLVDSTANVTDFSVDSTAGGAPLTVTFTDASTGAPSAWSWDFGDGTTLVGSDPAVHQNPVHQYAGIGTFTVTLTVTREGGTDTRTKADLISALDPIGVTDCGENTVSGPAPLSVNFTPTLSGDTTGVTYQWDFGDGNTSTDPQPSHTYSEGGPYTVSLDVEAVSGSFSFTDPNTIEALPPSGANFTSDTTGGLRVTFADTSSGSPTSWSWDFGDGTTLSGSNPAIHQNPTHDFATNGAFSVMLTVNGPGGPSVRTQTVTTSAISFQTAVHDGIILVSCQSCHGTGGVAASILLLDGGSAAAYANLVNVTPAGSGGVCATNRVTPFDPEDSLMVKVLEGTCPQVSTSMTPSGGQPTINIVRNWISQGAAQ